MAEDKDGNLWYGTNSNGVSKYDGTRFTLFTTKDGLVDNTVNSIVVDKNGHLWIAGYQHGVCQYDGRKFTTLDTSNGFLSNNVYTIMKDSKENL